MYHILFLLYIGVKIFGRLKKYSLKNTDSTSSSTVECLTGVGYDWSNMWGRQDLLGIMRFRNWRDERFRRQRVLRNQDLEAGVVRIIIFLNIYDNMNMTSLNLNKLIIDMVSLLKRYCLRVFKTHFRNW